MLGFITVIIFCQRLIVHRCEARKLALTIPACNFYKSIFSGIDDYDFSK